MLPRKIISLEIRLFERSPKNGQKNLEKALRWKWKVKGEKGEFKI